MSERQEVADILDGLTAPTADDVYREVREYDTRDVLAAVGSTAKAGGGAAGLFDAYAYLRDEKSNNTAAGDGVNGTWNVRTLNTEVFDTDGIVSLAANQFTLTAGTYFVVARAPGLFVGKERARIYNATDATIVGLGASTYSFTGAEAGSIDCWVETRVTLAGAKALELQQYTELNASFGVGLGTPTNAGATEVYAEVWIYREPA